ncbi:MULTISPECIES: AMP-binding protein [Tsukamurella]|uniref:AMP-binding protein n=2 Tax=Tsukamurella TaxID=2060 RepID=A0A5C5RYQ7_9ACTN|nr:MULTISPECIES: AMP-binding protein [Tsukamurella]NMD54253.1 AMP-binding protein [Tsukamurella columbiensis]TWS28227.1 AMP-binding protein [Tsukamurella conjunctivitidis]
MKFNLADIFEAVVDAVPERIVLSYEGDQTSYAEMDEQANQVAHLFAAQGIGAFDHVALFLKNSVEHVQSLVALIKIRAVPVNVNYRYTGPELEYIFTNSDARGIVVEMPEHQRTLAGLIGKLPDLRTVFVVGPVEPELATAVDGAPDVALVPFADAAAQSTARDFEKRTGEEHYIIYTGGTTGYPKGVVWQHDDFFRKPLSAGVPYGGEPRQNLDEVGQGAKDFPPLAFLIAAPLMHGAAAYSLFTFFVLGSRVILERDFKAAEIVRNIQRDQTQTILIVGDAMGIPLVEEMEKQKDTADFSSLFSITSGGAIWSKHVRDRMAAIKPELILRDNFGASESGNDGVMTLDENGNLHAPPTEKMMVVDESFQQITTPGEVGYIARVGNVPLGYYNDPEKSARTFPTLADGRRISVLGDMGYPAEDGGIVFLGRGSQCINTGGEKVYAEEVEATLHGHPAISDALVVPVPDARYGQRVAAVISVAEGKDRPSVEDVQTFARSELAGYKVPRTIVFVDQVKRTPAGKADYRWAKSTAETAAEKAGEEQPA